MPDADTQLVAVSASSVPITLREVRFVNAYIEHGIAVKAAREAGIQGESDNAIRKLAYQMLAKPAVAQYLRECRQEHLETAKVTTNKIGRALSNIVFADRTAVFGLNGDVISPRDWPENLRAIVSGFDAKVVTDRDGNVTRSFKIRFTDPMAAAKMLAEWRAMIGSRALISGRESSDGVITVILEGASQGDGDCPAEEANASNSVRLPRTSGAIETRVV